MAKFTAAGKPDKDNYGHLSFRVSADVWRGFSMMAAREGLSKNALAKQMILHCTKEMQAE